jgi:hypothetical protein
MHSLEVLFCGGEALLYVPRCFYRWRNSHMKNRECAGGCGASSSYRLCSWALNRGAHVMMSISSSAGLCSAIIGITCVSATAKGETWSCDQSVAEKTVNQVWIVSGDRLTTPSDERNYRIVRNDQHILVAFHKDWEYKIGGGTPFVSYVIIEKKTGTLIDLNDSVLTSLGEEYKDTATPDVGVGHCTLTQP